MASRRNLSTGLAAVVTASAAALGCCPSAAADPAAPTPQPNSTQQLPGLPGMPGLQALSQLSPIIQQAAGNPAQATQLLMAAAQAFAHSPTAPSESKTVATSVDQFVEPHVPPADLVPGAEAHLPPGINPVFAAGPGPAAPPAATPPASAPPVYAQASGTVQPVAASAATLPAPAPEAAPAPVPHMPPRDLVPGAEAHLPPGINPVYAAGPGPAAAPVATPPAPAPAAAPAPAPAPPPTPAAARPPAAGFGPDTPPTQDFMYPSIGTNCLADGSSAIATALSVAGPAKIPLPGPGPGQTAYVFTAVGTPGPAEAQKLPLNVTWVNLTTGKSGTAALKPRADINPNGPTTMTAIVDTGSGSIMSTIFGQVTTKEKQCQFMPTIGSTVVP